MRKWKMAYLITAIVIFIILMIPYFQNAWWTSGSSWWMAFLWMTLDYTQTYLLLLTFWMAEWILVLLYIQSLVKDIKRDEPEKLSL